MSSSVSAGVALAIMLAACDSTPPTPPPEDAGVDAGPPSPAVLLPCPPGWREVDDGAAAYCDPWPATGRRDDCAFDEAHLPGTPDCARIGPECPADGWPADLPTGRLIVYVDDDAPFGGDGATRATALRTIGEAADYAPAGAVIAVATGTYDESASGLDSHGAPWGGATLLHAGVDVYGACVSGTRVTSSNANELRAVLDVEAPSCGYHDLSVTGSARRALQVVAPNATLENIVVDDTTDQGLYVTHAGSVSVHDLVVRTVHTAPDGAFGWGVWVEMGSQATIDGAWIDGATSFGIASWDSGSMVTAHDVAIVHSVPNAGGNGRAIGSGYGGAVVLERAALEDGQGQGIGVGTGGTLTATDVVMRRFAAPCAWAQEDGSVELHRAYLEHCGIIGISAISAGHATVDDVLIRDVHPSTCVGCPTDVAYGMSAVGATSTLTASRLDVAKVDLCGVLVGPDGAMDLDTGVIDQTSIGACVQSDGYDLTRLSHDIEYRGVGVPLQATSYTLPTLLPEGM